MFLDIAVGILLSVFANWYFHLDLTPVLILICIFFTLSPNIDFLVSLLSKDRWQMVNRHRDLLHYPLFFLPIGLLLMSLFGKEWSILFLSGAFLHFAQDSVIFGWGVRWLWPFKKNHYVFLRGSLPSEKPGLPFRFMYAWTPEEVEKIGAEYGDPNWIENLYFRPSLILMGELLSLVIALAILYIYLYS